MIVGTTILWLQINRDESSLVIADQHYHATVLRTEAELQKGLSGTKSLPDDQAMLFVFPYSNQWSIWMKDMNYPIDIVWLDARSQVVHTVKNAQPSSYPERFTPGVSARYVIELSSGTVERIGIENGDSVRLPSGV